MLYDRDTFEYQNKTFRVQIEYEQGADAPWEHADGHGPVSDWTSRDKLPGERVLTSDRHSKRYYDVAEATRRAKRDGWGLGKEAETALAQTLGRAPTRGEIVAEAVRRDFEYLRSWCNDEWHYVSVGVTLLDDEGAEASDTEWLGMVEDSDNAYVREVARELADQICHEWNKQFAEAAEAARPDMYQEV